MPRSSASIRHRPLLLAGALLFAIGSLGACSDDDTSGGTTTTRSASPEAVQAPLAEVVAKLPTIVKGGNAAATAAARGEFDTAKKEFTDLHEVWEQVEGTIKSSDVDSYEKIETAQGLIRDGAENKNAKRAQQGADDQTKAINSFIKAKGS